MKINENKQNKLEQFIKKLDFTNTKKLIEETAKSGYVFDLKFQPLDFLFDGSNLNNNPKVVNEILKMIITYNFSLNSCFNVKTFPAVQKILDLGWTIYKISNPKKWLNNLTEFNDDDIDVMCEHDFPTFKKHNFVPGLLTKKDMNILSELEGTEILFNHLKLLQYKEKLSEMPESEVKSGKSKFIERTFENVKNLNASHLVDFEYKVLPLLNELEFKVKNYVPCEKPTLETTSTLDNEKRLTDKEYEEVMKELNNVHSNDQSNNSNVDHLGNDSANGEFYTDNFF